MLVTVCAHCSDLFKKEDNVCITDCGHVCHISCCRICQLPNGELECPKCSSNTRINRKIHLIMEDFTAPICDAEKEELDKWVKNSKIQLENIEKENLELRNKIKEMSERYESVELELPEKNARLKRDLRQLTLDLEKEIDTSSTLRKEKELEECDSKLQKHLEASEEQLKQNSNELYEQKKIIEKLCNEIKELENRLKQNADAAKKHQTAAATLQIKIEYLTKDINCKNREIEILKEEASRFAGYQNANPTIAVNEKIKNLEYKLKEMNAALEEELKNSFEWHLNKMKLERQLEQCEAKIIDMEEDRVKSEQILKMNIEKLAMEKNLKSKEVVEKTKEIQELIEKMGTLVSAETEVLLRERIASLNKKLDEAWHEIENQSKLATSLAQDKLKIQEQLAQNKRALEEAQEKFNKDLNELQNKMPNLKAQNELEVENTRSIPNSASATASGYDKFVFDTSNATEDETRSVVIRRIPNIFMGGHPIDIAIKFAQMLDINCTRTDIEEAFILESFLIQSSLVVKFKKSDLKIKFLVNKQKLRSMGIFINEFVEKEVYFLHQHAKSLKTVGYHSVFCKNNTVFARKTANSTPLRINNKEEVNKLAEEEMHKLKIIPDEDCVLL